MRGAEERFYSGCSLIGHPPGDRKCFASRQGCCDTAGSTLSHLKAVLSPYDHRASQVGNSGGAGKINRHNVPRDTARAVMYVGPGTNTGSAHLDWEGRRRGVEEGGTKEAGASFQSWVGGHHMGLGREKARGAPKVGGAA